MQHVTFALFRKPREARAAVARLAGAFGAAEDVKVLVSTGRTPTSDLEVYETHATRALWVGAGLGALAGATAGLVGAVAVARQHFDAGTLLFSVVAGIVIGAFASVLFGSINPNAQFHRLRRMSKACGGVIVTVESHSDEAREAVDHILRAHHGYLKTG